MRYPFVVHNYDLLAQQGTIQPIRDYCWSKGKIAGKSQCSIYGWDLP